MSQDIEELERKFGEAQQECVNKFKFHLQEAFEKSMRAFYTDVLNYATTDAHINYHNYLRDEFRESFIKEISTECGHYSWAHGIRMELLNQHKDILQNKIISDLQEKIKSLESHIEQMQRNRY